MAEKRVNKRSLIELAASYGIGEDSGPERGAKINNASAEGFCFVSEHALKVGQEINLAIDLDMDEEAIITVKVIWINKEKSDKKYTIGVQIIEKEGPGFERFLEFYSKYL